MIIGVTDHFRAPFHVEAKALGVDAEFVDFHSRNEADFDIAQLRRLDALLVWHARIGARTVDHLDNCKIVVRYGVGYDNIDLEAFKARGLPLCNNPDYGSEEVANTTVALLLNLWRKISAYDFASREITQGWAENVLPPISRISQSTLGLVGVGRIGGAVARRMAPFGCRILAYDPQLPPGQENQLDYQRVASLEQLCAEADAISLHCKLMPETAGMVNDRFLAAMKRGAILVNTARGGLLESLDAIERALRSGQLAGAGLDALPQEPPGDHPLLRAWRKQEAWVRGRLVVTPHTAWYSESSVLDMRHKAAQTIGLYLKDGTLRHRIV
ncbi:MAG: C-terminal binding protein [Burkholderiaceae bacterium]|nr:C-terminal binding protein [Burkholderiaceae bacterium]